MASAMPLFTIRSSRPISPKSEIFRGSRGLDVGVDEVAHVGLVGFEVDGFAAGLADDAPAASRRWSTSA